MLALPSRESPLESLKSSNELGLLDAVNSPRSHEVSHYVSPPQLTASSLLVKLDLETFSSIPFLTKDNLCTRFTTRLILRKTLIVELWNLNVLSQNRLEAE